jgi:hypothetical protein
MFDLGDSASNLPAVELSATIEPGVELNSVADDSTNIAATVADDSASDAHDSTMRTAATGRFAATADDGVFQGVHHGRHTFGDSASNQILDDLFERI